MAEPEELILEGAHFATRVAREAWRRYGTPAADRATSLAAVRARLELFLSALFRTSVGIASMAPAAPVSWLARLAGDRRERQDTRLLSGTDGRRVLLPAALPKAPWGEDALALYRLLAVEQASRLVRGTALASAQIESVETRDWFLFAEAAAIDRWIALEVPGLAGTLRAARAHAHAARLSAVHSLVEAQIRALLIADPLTPALVSTPEGSAEQSLAWARARGVRSDSRRYRAVSLPWYWGSILAAPRSVGPAGAYQFGEPERPTPRRPRVADMRRRPYVRDAAENEDDAHAGTWVIRADEPQESVEDPLGLQRPADRDDDADPEGLADSLSDLPEARLVRTAAQPREVLRAGEPIDRLAEQTAAPAGRRGLVYPEWDHRRHAYLPHGAIVRQPTAPLGDAAWVDAVRARHAQLVRRVRARFERLRPRYVTLNRQADGSEPDITAWVDAFAGVRAGVAMDGRMYVEHRPARRELAVALLADVSASTDGWVSDTRRIVDVEKEALLVVCEALDALGDRYGISAFSGENADNVAVLPLKTFDERRSLTVERRIAALDADGYTRVGAAIRHVTAALGRERTARRLLLILSDGKPNDVDVYEGPYGVEDTRQAVAEARRQGVSVFCLTVDREAPHYAGRIFGRDGFAILRRTDELPSVVIEVLQRLLR